ncbi:MAG: nucleotide exchange factor GrpE [Christensenellaceae bacterium]|jgi:molecular chaperone GrpE|nr:nucleotide exchange factor GrpE [Christensenellaceae bacterium]
MSRKKDKTNENLDDIKTSDAVSTASEEIKEEYADAEVVSDEKALEYLAMAQRVQAEFENYRKRNNESVRLAKIDGGNDVLMSILPVIDAVDRALSILTEKTSIEGVSLIRKQLASILTKYGVVEVGEVGDVFNPDFHNAVMREENSENSGKIIEVLQKGYSRNGKIIRYAMVKVAD